MRKINIFIVLTAMILMLGGCLPEDKPTTAGLVTKDQHNQNISVKDQVEKRAKDLPKPISLEASVRLFSDVLQPVPPHYLECESVVDEEEGPIYIIRYYCFWSDNNPAGGTVETITRYGFNAQTGMVDIE